MISLCKRHSATVVELALKEYVEEKKERKERKQKIGEKEEEELRNPSAFFTHMIGRIAEEGLGSVPVSTAAEIRGGCRGGSGRGRGRGGGRGGAPGRGSGRGDISDDANRRGKSESLQENLRVDMSISCRSGDDVGQASGKRISQIFPSMKRGRGRGRGYM